MKKARADPAYSFKYKTKTTTGTPCRGAVQVNEMM